MKKSESILENLSLIMVVVALILFWLNDKKTKQIDFHLGIVIITLFVIIFLIGLYLDIKNRKYTTIIFIVIADIVEITAFISVCYLSFRHDYTNINHTNIDHFIDRASTITLISLILPTVSLIKSILKAKDSRKRISIYWSKVRWQKSYE